MEFYAVLDQLINLLRQRGRVTYRALKLQFGLDDEQLEILKEELLYAQQLAVDEENRVLVWVGAPSVESTPPLAVPPPAVLSLSTDQERAPLSYNPRILPRRFSRPAAPWKVSANRSRCASAIWRTRPPLPNALGQTTCTPC